MKWLILVLLLLVLPLSSAITTDLLPEYLPGETIITKISGNILEPINPSEVIFKRNHVAIAVVYDIKRFGSDYYLYAQAPLNPNNYTLVINDLVTTVNGVQTTIDFNQSFKVQGNITDYSINPGLAIVTGNSVSFNINSNLDQPITINYNFPQDGSITLNPGSNSLNLPVSSKENGIYLAQIGKYTIPIQLTRNVQTINNSSKKLIVSPQNINRVILKDNNFSFNLTLTNNGSSSLTNLKFNFANTGLSFVPEEISSLAQFESSIVSVSLSRLTGSPIEGEIIFFDDLEQLGNISVKLVFTSNQNETVPSGNESVAQYYCSELQGIFCTTEETCSAEQVQSLDGLCCKGTCNIPKKSGFGWVAYVVIGIVLIIIIVVFMKYRKSSVPQIKPSLISPLSKKI